MYFKFSFVMFIQVVVTLGASKQAGQFSAITGSLFCKAKLKLFSWIYVHVYT